MPASAPARSDAQTPAEGNVFSRAMRPVNTVVERFIPSSLMFTIVLTFLVAILCLLSWLAGIPRMPIQSYLFVFLVAAGFAIPPHPEGP
ncbi:hypothetical protein [Micrococcus lylae]|uniref:hypothetical protein n=1 Tax=Micrococcus lylae TaxID=1273 RepID=UPI00082DB17B|nr:hypothetical protein [Micrococcus lylae]